MDTIDMNCNECGEDVTAEITAMRRGVDYADVEVVCPECGASDTLYLEKE